MANMKSIFYAIFGSTTSDNTPNAAMHTTNHSVPQDTTASEDDPKVTIANDVITANAAAEHPAHDAAKQTPKKGRKRKTDNEHSTLGVNSVKPKQKQLKVVTHDARSPSGTSFAKYDTNHYRLYNAANIEPVQPGPKVFTKFGNYDHLPLYSNAALENADVLPTGGVVRLDDLACKIAIDKFGAKYRSDNWVVEFDKAGMTRATRMPLGFAAKVWKDIGDKDCEGNVLEDGEQGYYYLWHRGLQLLCGKEGLDAKMFDIRPSHETAAKESFTWKKSHKAVIQAKAGQEPA